MLLPSVQTSGQPIVLPFPFLIFPYAREGGEQSVIPSLSFGETGGKSRCRITSPRWTSDFCSSFCISPAWTLYLIAPSTFTNILGLQWLRAAFEGASLLPADPGALSGTIQLR